jgi:hypothetical protein
VFAAQVENTSLNRIPLLAWLSFCLSRPAGVLDTTRIRCEAPQVANQPRHTSRGRFRSPRSVLRIWYRRKTRNTPLPFLSPAVRQIGNRMEGDVGIALDLRPWIDARNGNIHDDRFLKVIGICFQIRIDEMNQPLPHEMRFRPLQPVDAGISRGY